MADLTKIGLCLWLLLACTSPVQADGKVSSCYGTPANGFLKNGVALPEKGTNFGPYSSLGVALGRHYVHSTVKEIVVAAYGKLAKQFPDKKFVYGETGWEEGGNFAPHKTHRNGTSVDFMVPVLNKKGQSVALPTSVFNKFGYNVEFDKNGKYEALAIDFEALAAHIHYLNESAHKHKVGIQRVIFDPRLQPLLFQTRYGKLLKGKLKFNTKRAWVRHDEHIHVDFTIPCKKMN
jgi:penicillin-insensitive murein DD-endopeptidase